MQFVHGVPRPVSEAHVPTGHLRQKVEFGAATVSEYNPAPHCVQVVAAEGEYVPTGQFVHTTLVEVVAATWAYCPVGQMGSTLVQAPLTK